MHIPDGNFLSPAVFGTLDVAAVVAVGVAIRRANKTFTEDRHVPLLGVSGAFVFAAQMLNFPIPGGMSGHFLGAALAGMLLGSSGAVLVLTAVLIVQALLFGDGGRLVLGANIINMAVLGGVIGPAAAGVVRRLFREPGGARARKVGAFVGAWLSCVLPAFACGIELTLSYPEKFPPVWIVGVMTSTHAAIGVLEGVVTVAALELIARARPDLLAIEKA
jgi:cobalt/nickel transport system permease protein